jgi:hypothetical protein
MLVRMRAVLDREAARLGEDGLEGKAAVDQVALIARTLEKIDQMERLIAEDQARVRSQTLSPEEREQMRQTVRQLILAAAERMAASGGRRMARPRQARSANGLKEQARHAASPLGRSMTVEAPAIGRCSVPPCMASRLGTIRCPRGADAHMLAWLERHRCGAHPWSEPGAGRLAGHRPAAGLSALCRTWSQPTSRGFDDRR